MDTTKVEPIKLDFDSEQQVMVTPENKDRFFTTAEHAARACQIYERTMQWRDEFESFLAATAAWCREQSDLISAGYVEIGEGGLSVLIVTRELAFDFAIADRVVKLELALREKYPSCPCEVLQIPSSNLNLSSDSIQVYGNSE